MSKVINISTHKNYRVMYSGIACRVRDKQALMNQSMLDLASSEFDVRVDVGPEISDRLQKAIDEFKAIGDWFAGEDE